MKRKRITTAVSKSNSSFSTKDVKNKDYSKSVSKGSLAIQTPSSVSMTSLIMHNRENLSKQNKGNEQQINNKEIRNIHSDCSLRQPISLPCTTIASIHGRRDPTSLTGCLLSLNKETKIQSPWINDTECDNIPVYLIIKDKGRFKHTILGCILENKRLLMFCC